jgi:predicted RNase H-like HicB family nuclease
MLTRDQYLRIPYVLVIESVPRPDGDWCRRASFPEVPGAVAEAESAIEAMDVADERRVKIILDWLDAGIPVPVPRPPLQD